MFAGKSGPKPEESKIPTPGEREQGSDTPRLPRIPHGSKKRLETPSESYSASEACLYGRLAIGGHHSDHHILNGLLSDLKIQSVFSRHASFAQIDVRTVDPLALGFLAHIYNSTLGTDFLVAQSDTALYLYSDGAVRRRLEDLQEQDKLTEVERARFWMRHKLESFLALLPDEKPNLERCLLAAVPENTRAANTPGLLRRERPLFVSDIVVPTANRPIQLLRLLNALQKNLQFYHYQPENITIHVVDTSLTEHDRVAIERICSRAAHTGLRVLYRGPDEIRDKLAQIAIRLHGKAQAAFSKVFLRGIFSPTGEKGDPVTIGTIRNAISLFMHSTPYISVDDDMMFDALIPSLGEYKRLHSNAVSHTHELDLHVGAANDFVKIVSLPQNAFTRDLSAFPTDFIGIANRNLDTPVYLAESRIVGERELSKFKEKGRISVVRPYLSNASPDVTTFLRNFMRSGIADDLTGAKAECFLPVDVSSACLRRGYSSGTMFATSSSLEVPFLDTRAYEDVAQSQLTELLHPDDVQFQGGMVEHRRAVGSRVMNSAQYVDVLIGFQSMTRYISTVLPDSFVTCSLLTAPSRDAVLKRLGKKMHRDAAGAIVGPHTMESMIGAYQRMGRLLRDAKIEGSGSFKTDAVEIEAEIRDRYRVLLKKNGLLYFYWQQFAAAADECAWASSWTSRHG